MPVKIRHNQSYFQTYKVVYQNLQCEQVVPFCQSELFLGELLGSPPVSLDDLLGTAKERQARNERRRNAMGQSDFAFSFTRFRWEFFIAKF